VLWQPKGFNDESASRVAISFQVTPEVEDDMRALDVWILEKVASDTKRFLGNDLSPAQVRERYVSALRTHEKGWKNLRCKMNLHGRSAARCWDADKKACGHPEDWTTACIRPRLLIKGLWIMNREFGLLIEMTDAQVSEEQTTCPF
jgi:hypothetical protein